MKFHTKFFAFCAVVSGVNGFVVKNPNKVLRDASVASYFGNPEEGQAEAGLGMPGPAGPGGAMQSSASPAGAQMQSGDIWDTLSPVKVQGGSLRTWSFTTHTVERVQVLLKTEGRPLNANVELWQGPDNTPQKMGIYIEDGSVRPFNCVIETPKAMGNAIAIYNTSPLEYPLVAGVKGEIEGSGANVVPFAEKLSEMSSFETVQGGGTIRTYPFPPTVASVQVLLRTDGRPLNARIELLQGPNNNKQIMEIYTEDGDARPFCCVIDCPGHGNVVRIVNTAPVEYPLVACVEPYLLDEESMSIGAGGDEFFIISDSLTGMR